VHVKDKRLSCLWAYLSTMPWRCILCLIKCHPTETYGEIAPCMLNLGTVWRWVVGFVPQLLHSLRKSPWYSLDRRLGTPQIWVGHGGEEKNPCSCWKSNPGHPSCSLVTILTELSWFLLSAYIILNMFKSLQEKWSRGTHKKLTLILDYSNFIKERLWKLHLLVRRSLQGM
jgi:hypothetical protein